MVSYTKKKQDCFVLPVIRAVSADRHTTLDKHRALYPPCVSSAPPGISPCVLSARFIRYTLYPPCVVSRSSSYPPRTSRLRSIRRPYTMTPDPGLRYRNHPQAGFAALSARLRTAEYPARIRSCLEIVLRIPRASYFCLSLDTRTCSML